MNGDLNRPLGAEGSVKLELKNVFYKKQKFFDTISTSFARSKKRIRVSEVKGELGIYEFFVNGDIIFSENRLSSSLLLQDFLLADNDKVNFSYKLQKKPKLSQHEKKIF